MKKEIQKLNLKKCISIFVAAAALLITFDTHAQLISTITGNGTGAYNGDGIAATTAEVNMPSGVAVDKAGNVYIADNLNSRIRKIDASTGFISTIAGTGTAGYNGDAIAATVAEINRPWNISLDSVGNIYIASWGDSRIRKVTVSTGFISTIAGTGAAGYNGDGIAANIAELNQPATVILDKAGNIYISDVNNHRIRKIDASTGLISTIAGTGTPGYNGNGIAATTAELHNPNTICLDTLGNIYIADYYNNEIRKVTISTGIISAVVGTGTGGFNGDGIPATSAELYYPAGIAIDGSNQNLYIGDYNNNRVRKVNISTGIISTVAGDGTPGYNGDGILATSAELYNPWGVLVTNTDFYISDYSNNRVRKVPIPSTAGINEVLNGIKATVYPNPVSETLNIYVEGTKGENRLTLLNNFGQKVLQEYTSEKNTSISVSTLSSGIYFLEILTQDGSMSVRKVCIAK